MDRLNIEPFRAWLANNDGLPSAIPGDCDQCIIAKWLQDVGYSKPRVDGECIFLSDELGNIETPSWANHVISSFDDMASDMALPASLRCVPIEPEQYREPLLELVERLIANANAWGAE
jgi:hypothetical protein